MAQAQVTALRSVDMGVTNLKARQQFYQDIWGLETVAERPGSAYLRGTGASDHLVALHDRPRAEMLRIDLTAPDKAAVDALAIAVKEAGAKSVEKPAAITEPGGGYGFSFLDPEGRTVRIITGDTRHADTADNPDRPRKLSHVVLNSRDPAAMTAFYGRTLGFKLSDRTQMMSFIRCNTDHHSLAFVQSDHASLHHIAFEMQAIDSVMRGAGRMRDNGFPIEWGVGRHGPGNNVFAYFLSPDEMVIEYTAEVEQVDDKYVTHGPDYWVWPKGRNDHWGINAGPSERMREAHNLIGFTPELFRAAG
jgi:catechol 2,3-dioxygenase-like lactoylglutathione lyase family enzyme